MLVLGDSSDYKDEIVRIKAMARQHDRDTDIYGSLESNRESAFQLIQKAISDLFDWLLAASKEEITPSIDRKDQVMRQAEISQGTRSMDAGNKAEPDAKDVRVDEKTMIQEDIRHSNDQTKLHSNSDRRVIIKIAGTASLLRETRGTTGSPLCSRDSSHSTARESSSGELDISCLSDGFGQMSLKSHPTPTGVFDQLDRIARPEHNPNPGINNIFRQHGSPPWLPHPLKDLDSAIGLLISLPNWQMDTFPGQDHIAKLVVQMIYVGLLNKLIACASSLYAQLCLQSLDDPFSASEIFFACVGRLSQHYQQLAELNFPFANFLDAAIQRLQVFESFMKPNLAVGRESRGRASMSAMEESLQIYRIKSACGLPFRSYRPLALACYFASDSEEEIGNDSMMQGVEGNVTKGLVSMTVMELLLSN